ncbi:MAG: helix-turn-helix domain-containing protein [Clostridiales bacterium]|nr:helix-turn-helix domain-containing protein [Clostridiales bacterium]
METGAAARDVSHRIYQLLTAKCKSQAAVARAAGLSPKHFNNILRGQQTLRPEYVVPVCKALECTPNELFGYGGDGGK